MLPRNIFFARYHPFAAPPLDPRQAYHTRPPNAQERSAAWRQTLDAGGPGVVDGCQVRRDGTLPGLR